MNYEQEFELLETALERVLSTYSLVETASAEALRTFPTDGSADDDLRELWRTLKLDQELPSLNGKHWQEVRSVSSLRYLQNLRNNMLLFNSWVFSEPSYS
jgi:hypothetical protein